MHAAAQPHRQAVRVERAAGLHIQRAIHAQHRVATDGAQRALLLQEAALELTGHALLALLHRHHIRAENLPLADGKHLPRVAVGNGVTQRGIAPALRIVKGQRADPGGGIAHPCAHVYLARRLILPRGQHGLHAHTVAQVLYRHGHISRTGDDGGQLLA